ncbi:MAG: efflux RND transporter periplasmic adaptor subunit [Candidatus Methylacidiphilales bacterium]|nr:efflux RND transporter periplasmic adaptor subunit [Candidatus Methylacidiphilales bacterium]
MYPISKTVLASLSLCIIALLTACHSGQPPAQQHAMPPRVVGTFIAQKKDVPNYLADIGRCVSLEVVQIVPQVAGKIMEIHFKDGSYVKKGDPLFTIDPRPYKAELAQAEATLAKDKAQLELSKINLARSEKLVAGNYVSSSDIDTLKTNVASSEAQLQQDTAMIDKAKLNLDYCYIKAPIDGLLGVRAIDVGNVVMMNNTALITIQRLNPIYAEFTCTEGQLPSVRMGAKQSKKPLEVEVSFPDNPQLKRTGELVLIDNAVKMETGTVKLRAQLPNDDSLFWPQQFVHTKLTLETISGAVIIPAEAVQIGQQGAFVFVVKDDAEKKGKAAELRPVKVGQLYDKMIHIKEGVKEGEEVIVTGQFGIAPGGAVNPHPYDPANPAATPAPAPAAAQKDAPKDKDASGKEQSGS